MLNLEIHRRAVCGIAVFPGLVGHGCAQRALGNLGRVFYCLARVV